MFYQSVMHYFISKMRLRLEFETIDWQQSEEIRSDENSWISFYSSAEGIFKITLLCKGKKLH